MNEENADNFIYGKNPILEILENNLRRINKIYIQQGISYDNRLKKIVEKANEKRIVIQKTNIQKFSKYFDENTNLQGVIASVSSVEYIELNDFLNIKSDKYKKIIILDSISDPHNFGAIIRTAVSAGFDGILIANHRSCPITPIVEKTSSGAINHISIIKTTSLSASIDELKRNNFWVIATQMNASDNYFEIDYTDMNFAVIMGSEGSGISKTLLNKADYKIKIPGNFESLNVACATAVIAYEAFRQIYMKSKKN